MTEIGRDRHVRPSVTLENCDAILLYLEPDKMSSIVVWRDGPKLVETEGRKPIRQIRAGDVIKFNGELREVFGVEIYR
jgi:hypothetical protein